MKKFLTFVVIIVAAVAICVFLDLPVKETVQEFAITLGFSPVTEEVSENAAQPENSYADTSAVEETGPTVAVTHTEAPSYAYGTLSEEEQKTYDEMVYAIENFETDFILTTKNLNALEPAFNAVMADHGEYFWVQGYSYRNYYPENEPDNITKLEFTPNFTMTEEEKDADQVQVDTAVASYLAGADSYSTDYEKALYLYERLITDVDYVENSAENQNILSVFLYGQTVCSGYSNAYQYLLSQLGIECAVVRGTAKGGAHAWNLVLLDGEYYYIDVTWGNSSYSMGEDTQAQYYINYGYFGATTDELMRTHTDGGAIALPNCTATYDNYYIKSGLYFDVADWDAIGNVFRNSYYNSQRISIKFANQEILNEAVDYFISNQHIVDYCPGLTSIQYIADDELYILNFKF